MSTSWYLDFSWWMIWLTLRVMAWPGHISLISRNQPVGEAWLAMMCFGKVARLIAAGWQKLLVQRFHVPSLIVG